MADILIRGYKAKEQIEDIIKEARYAANNCMIGSGLEIIELPEHGDLIDRDALGEAPTYYGSHCNLDDVEDWINSEPVVIPSNKEDD